MLKGIDPLLVPDLLKVLAAMGHDDAIVLADCNFTAERIADGRPVIRLPGADMVRTVRAVQSVLPLAVDVAHPVRYMQVGGTEAPYRSALQREVMALLAPEFGEGQDGEGVERFRFYDLAGAARAIVLTGERQPWGNFILRKGVIGEALRR